MDLSKLTPRQLEIYNAGRASAFADLLSLVQRMRFAPPDEAALHEPDPRLTIPILDLDIHYTTQEALERAGIRNVGQLVKYTPGELVEEVDGIANKRLVAIQLALAGIGLELAKDPNAR